DDRLERGDPYGNLYLRRCRDGEHWRDDGAGGGWPALVLGGRGGGRGRSLPDASRRGAAGSPPVSPYARRPHDLGRRAVRRALLSRREEIRLSGRAVHQLAAGGGVQYLPRHGTRSGDDGIGLAPACAFQMASTRFFDGARPSWSALSAYFCASAPPH